MVWKINNKTYDIIRGEITPEMIKILAEQTTKVIQCKVCPNTGIKNEFHRKIYTQNLGENYNDISNKISNDNQPTNTLVSLDKFITNLVLKSKVQAGTLICTLIYLERLKKRLPLGAKGIECTYHRIFLASLIIAGKYLNDASPKNKYWARYSNMFSIPEVNLMEKQFLFLLDFDLRIEGEDLDKVAEYFYPENLYRDNNTNMDITSSPKFNRVELQNPMASQTSIQPREMLVKPRKNTLNFPKLTSMDVLNKNNMDINHHIVPPPPVKSENGLPRGRSLSLFQIDSLNPLHTNRTESGNPSMYNYESLLFLENFELGSLENKNNNSGADNPENYRINSNSIPYEKLSKIKPRHKYKPEECFLGIPNSNQNKNRVFESKNFKKVESITKHQKNENRSQLSIYRQNNEIISNKELECIPPIQPLPALCKPGSTTYNNRINNISLKNQEFINYNTQTNSTELQNMLQVDTNENTKELKKRNRRKSSIGNPFIPLRRLSISNMGNQIGRILPSWFGKNHNDKKK
ncbi:hypothetical protein BB559_000485 [Furculomyces boomerangus]|uniref:Cyclin N-terminal domain-containing protein n=2 Tax=Harpellales TaxID=61421 RepID=A0A2T9Z509_9FUNG|nr:hypothetical protein BB559_004674 [Furculomyces boomerangus]PVU99688.1 hypothetical protein BB559_000485 [Furculomyces boomerangus]PVZ97476.1 hypothetical protein BB558_006561 [Smittium angustum]PVZ99622.1 hypothetical protein BB558_004347 [Smittium angustum]